MSTQGLAARIRQPASAAVAGIVFAVLFTSVVVLLRRAVPAQVASSGDWADSPYRDPVNLALNLMPFAGLALLWFIAVVRAEIASLKDRFLETVFLGSGLIFIATLFCAAASLRAVLLMSDHGSVDEGVRRFAWALAAALLVEFGARMAAVFVLCATTIGRTAGTFPRWLSVVGYAVGLVLLLTPPVPRVGQLLFPTWVLVISAFVLAGGHRRAARAGVEAQPPEGS
jgi:hypothetical protein